MSTPNQQRLAETFVSLADTLVDDFDLLDFLALLAERASELLNVAAAGVILSDQRGGCRPTASSDEAPALVHLFISQATNGPCMECVRTGTPVTSPDLAEEAERWPHFAPRAVQAGYRAAAAVPMRFRNRVIGSLTLLNTTTGDVHEPSQQLGQSLADMATIGLLQHRTAQRDDPLVEQLQAALHHRAVIEQAKGVLAEHGGLPPDKAYEQLRGYARNTGEHLSELARDVATGDRDPEQILTTHRH